MLEARTTVDEDPKAGIATGVIGGTLKRNTAELEAHGPLLEPLLRLQS